MKNESSPKRNDDINGKVKAENKIIINHIAN